MNRNRLLSLLSPLVLLALWEGAVRLGWLNYLVSGPEVHRWHHSKAIAESNNNYAHSFVVWDLVFGTYFRPKERAVGDLGLLDAAFPLGFFRQLGAPFRRAAPATDAPS